MLAKIYYNALMTSLNSRRSTSKDNWGDFESRDPTRQMTLTFMHTTTGQVHTMDNERGETVVHISKSTEQDLGATDTHSVGEELKAKVCVFLRQCHIFAKLISR
jgi:hypothetical protein